MQNVTLDDYFGVRSTFSQPFLLSEASLSLDVPRVETFVLDLNNRSLFVQVESALPVSINASGITLSTQSSSLAQIIFRKHRFTLELTGFRVSLLPIELQNIVLHNLTVLSVSADTLVNEFGTGNAEVSALTGTLLPDVDPPQLVSFSISIRSRQSAFLTLSLSEPMNASTLMQSSFVLQSSSPCVECARVPIFITNITSSREDSMSFVLVLDQETADLIVSLSSLTRSSVLVCNQTVVTDVSGNVMQAPASASALSFFVERSSPSTLLSDDNTLSLPFYV
jgi:hypothetical protein